jgi:serine/threonine protein kinase
MKPIIPSIHRLASYEKMYDASEIGLDWRGTLDMMSSVPNSKCSLVKPNNHLEDYTGRLRAVLKMEETVVDSTMGKLVWAKRLTSQDNHYRDCLVKKTTSQAHSKQEAVIQWLCYKTLSALNWSEHCPPVFDVFVYSKSIWFSMAPIYKAPVLDIYLKTLTTWRIKHPGNGQYLMRILCQVACCCLVLQKTIGFNHRDLKPDNVLVKTESVKPHILRFDDSVITVQSAPTAVLVDFGFSCLGPGKTPWIQAGDDVLPAFDACPRIGRDLFMLLTFLLWRKDIQESLTDDYIDFIKSSLRLTTERWSQIQGMSVNPKDWIYSMVTDFGFQCPALDPMTWLESCATTFPGVVSIRTQSAS